MTGDPAGPVAGLVLAAGSSIRRGRNKLLLTLKGEAIVRRAARLAVAVLDPVIVVLGHEAEEVRQEPVGLPCRTLVTPGRRSGIPLSVRGGAPPLPRRRGGRLCAAPRDAPPPVAG